MFGPLAEELALWTTLNCQPFEPAFVAHVLSFSRYAGVLTTIGLTLASLRYCELYLFLFSIASLFNLAANLLLRAIVHDTTLVVSSCVDVYAFSGNWPSFQTQDTAFVVTFLASYAVMYRTRVHLLSFFLLVLYLAAVIAGDLHLNYHTRSQIVGASLIGTSIAVVAQFVIRLLIAPFFPTIVGLSLVRYFGYGDSLLGDQTKLE